CTLRPSVVAPSTQRRTGLDFVVIAQAPAIECVYDRKKDEPMFSGMGDKKQ
ncbi:hypothetical protein PROVRUST_08556, partial [Providencia rustigianii DSM 4541]